MLPGKESVLLKSVSCQHEKINPNFKIWLAYWSTFKFGLIFCILTSNKETLAVVRFLPSNFVAQVEKNLKDSLDSKQSPSPSGKIQIIGEKVCLRCKVKTLLGIVNKLLKKKVCWQHPAMFWLITSSKLFRQ